MAQTILHAPFEDVFSLETERYQFTFQRTVAGAGRIVQRAKGAGGHFARHYRYHGPTQFDSVHRPRNIDEWAAKRIFSRIPDLGDTLAFTSRAFILDGDDVSQRKITIDPRDVRHHQTNQEQSYTATGAKLAYHWPIFKKLRETGYGSLIRATMTNHQVCSSKCEFCSTIGREKRDSVTLSEAQSFFDTLYFDQAEHNKKYFSEYNDLYKTATGSDIRLRGLILSGGGQPNLWPDFEAFVKYVAKHDVSLGLITNGFPKGVDDTLYSEFEWIRLSITPAEASTFYRNGRFEEQPLPDFRTLSPRTKVGISYVYGPWTTDDELLRLEAFCWDKGVHYCRLLTDCNLERDEQLRQHISLAERLYKLKLIDSRGRPQGKIFHQLKYHASDEEMNNVWDSGQCFVQSYSVFWDTTGHEEFGDSYCYPCDSVTVLTHSGSDKSIITSERRFDQVKWGTVPSKKVRTLYESPLQAFFDPRQNCKGCLFVKNNQAVKNLLTSENDSCDQSLEHVNFP